MRRIAIAITFLILAYGLPSRAQQNFTSLEFQDRYVELGRLVTVPIILQTDTAVNRANFSVIFDPTRLAYESYAVGPDYSSSINGGFVLTIPQPGNGYFAADLYTFPTSAIFPLNHRNIVFLLTFRAIGQMTGPTQIRFGDTPRLMVNPSGGLVPTSYFTGTVSVIAPNSGRFVYIAPKSVHIGTTETFSVRLQSQGNENAVGFSVAYDQTRMVFEGAMNGFDAQAASLILNHQTSGPNAGRVGVALALNAGQSFAQGDPEIVLLRFRILADPFAQPYENPFTFFDSPVSGEVVTTAAQAISPVYVQTAIQIVNAFEGDVAPRPGGNLSTTLADWVQIGRFAAALDIATPGLEFQKADCAPTSTRGNGQITLADWVQAGRFAANLDSTQTVGGPTSFAGFSEPTDLITSLQQIQRLPESARRVLLSPLLDRSTDELRYSITLHGRGNENAVAFTLEYDAGELELLDVRPADERAAIHLNRTESGRVGIVLALPPGQSLGAGEVLVLRFSNLRRGIVAQSLHFADGKVAGEVVTVEAESVPAVFAVEVGRVIRRRH